MEFSRLEHPSTKAARTRAERTVMEAVAQELGNTPAVARSSYVDPRVVETFGRGQTIARALSRIGTDDLTDPDVRLAGGACRDPPAEALSGARLRIG